MLMLSTNARHVEIVVAPRVERVVASSSNFRCIFRLKATEGLARLATDGDKLAHVMATVLES
jgi:hypothetical protein